MQTAESYAMNIPLLIAFYENIEKIEELKTPSSLAKLNTFVWI